MPAKKKASTVAKKKASKVAKKAKAPATKKAAAAKKAPVAKKTPAAKKAPAVKRAPVVKKAPAEKKVAAPAPVAVAVAAPAEVVVVAAPAPPTPSPTPAPVSRTEPPPSSIEPVPDLTSDASDALEENFHGQPVPAPLAALHRWALARPNEWFSGRFEFVTGPERWFAAAGHPEADEQLCYFGEDADGSLYAFWTYASLPVDEAPIVYMSSDNSDSSVLASSALEFMALLTLDAKDLGRTGWDGGQPMNNPGHPAYVAWLNANYGVDRPTNPTRIVKRAREAHPDLQAWVNKIMG